MPGAPAAHALFVDPQEFLQQGRIEQAASGMHIEHLPTAVRPARAHVLEASGAAVQAIQSGARAHPEVLCIGLRQAPDAVVGKAGAVPPIMLIDHEAFAVEAGKSITGAEPQEAIAILQHMVHHALRQALVHVVAGHLHLLRPQGGSQTTREKDGEMGAVQTARSSVMERLFKAMCAGELELSKMPSGSEKAKTCPW